jgi:hypothetical protein
VSVFVPLEFVPSCVCGVARLANLSVRLSSGDYVLLCGCLVVAVRICVKGLARESLAAEIAAQREINYLLVWSRRQDTCAIEFHCADF